jgi:hypothetical protein
MKWLFIFALAACTSKPAAEIAIEQLMMEQQQAWNSGDLMGFMEPYWKSEHIMFIGKKGGHPWLGFHPGAIPAQLSHASCHGKVRILYPAIGV